MVSKEGFIACWHDAVAPQNRMPDGVVYPELGIRRMARPCDCGEDGCRGWQMAYDDEYAASFDLLRRIERGPPS